MKCENCQAELKPGSAVCPECGFPVPQRIEGFENAVKIQRILRAISLAGGKNILTNTFRFTALINDCLADFDKERRLLVNMLNAGILKSMLEESDNSIAIMRARSSMQNDCFIIESAAEFVLACFTYVLGWPYESPLRVGAPKVKAEKKPPKEKEPKKEKAKTKGLTPEDRVFRPKDAIKFRLSRNVAIPEGFTKIEAFCFDKYSSMRSIEFPDTLMAVGEFAFSECKNLKTAVLPESLRILEQGAFSQCTKLTSVLIPEGIPEIPDNTFLCCQSLEAVEIPVSVTSIGASAFSGCEQLKTLFLHDSVKYIDDEAFLECPALTIRCIENSYVHKYCLSHTIKFETITKEIDLQLMEEGTND